MIALKDVAHGSDFGWTSSVPWKYDYTALLRQWSMADDLSYMCDSLKPVERIKGQERAEARR